MTELKGDDRVIRKVQAQERGKQIVVELHPQYIELRRLGCQESYTMSYEALYSRAAQNAASRAIMEAKAEKAIRKVARRA